MPVLENIYCLGCKKRHSTVDVKTVDTLYVKGSPRYQAKGFCVEGKKWTKLLNKTERETLKDMMVDNEDTSLNLESTPKQLEALVIDDVIVEEHKGVEVDNIVELIEPLALEVENEPEVQLHSETPIVQHYPSVDEEKVLDTVMVENSREVISETPLIEQEVINLHREVRQLQPTQRRQQPVQNKQSDIQAFRVGRHLGYSSAVRVGPKYSLYLRQHFDKSGLEMRFFDAFSREYTQAGDNYIRSLNEEYVEAKEITPDGNNDGLSTPAVAGLAAASIFGAWMAAKFNKR